MTICWPSDCLVGAVDVGGTKMASALLRAGEIVWRDEVPSREPNTDAWLADPGAAILCRVVHHLDQVAAELGSAVHSVGVGVPEYVTEDGQVTSREVMGWPQPLPHRSAGRPPTLVESDVRCGAIAEWHLGGHTVPGTNRPITSLLYVSLGTGLSHTLVQYGEPVIGARGRAIALGEMRLPAAAINLEQRCSGRGLADTWNRNRLSAGDKPLSTREFIDLAATDGQAHRFLSDAAQLLAWAIEQSAMLLDPDVVVLGGGLGIADTAYRNLLVRHYDEQHPAIPLVLARLGRDSGLYGAAIRSLRQAGACL